MSLPNTVETLSEFVPAAWDSNPLPGIPHFNYLQFMKLCQTVALCFLLSVASCTSYEEFYPTFSFNGEERNDLIVDRVPPQYYYKDPTAAMCVIPAPCEFALELEVESDSLLRGCFYHIQQAEDSVTALLKVFRIDGGRESILSNSTIDFLIRDPKTIERIEVISLECRDLVVKFTYHKMIGE